jgi:hypothetical protein
VLFRAAAAEAPPRELVAEVEALFGLGPQRADVLRYEDRRRHQWRAMGLQRVGSDAHLTSFVLAGDTTAEGWVRALLQDRLPAQSYGRLLLKPDAKPPVALAERGRQVCACFNVSEPAIQDAQRRRRPAAGATATVAALRHQLRLVHPRAEAPGEGQCRAGVTAVARPRTADRAASSASSEQRAASSMAAGAHHLTPCRSGPRGAASPAPPPA